MSPVLPHLTERADAPGAEKVRITTAFKAAAVPVGAGLPANTGVAGASHRV